MLGDQDHEASRRPRFLILSLVWTLTAALAVWLVIGPHTHTFARDEVLYDLQAAACAAAVLVCAWRSRRGRVIWSLVGLSMAFAAAGNLALTLLSAGGEEPFPSAADPLFLLFYPGAYVALIMLMRSGVSGLPRSMWLDGVLVCLAQTGLVAALIYGPIALDAGTSRPALLAALAYPLLDTVLASMAVAGLIMFGWRTDLRLILLSAGLIALAVADFAYSQPIVAGTYAEGSWLDVLWPLSSALLAGSAWSRSVQRPPRRAPEWLIDAAPMTSTLVAAAMLVYGSVRAEPLPLLAVLPCAGVLALGVLRLHLSLRHARSLTATTRRLSSTDALTGLPNRRTFAALATGRLAASLAAGVPSTVLVVDLDGLKQINDSLGHAAGDTVLGAVALRLVDALRSPDDLLARLDGDEFALLLAGADGPAARSIVGRIHHTLRAPVEVAGVQVVPAVSVGVAVAPDDGTELGLLLRRADIALHRAKAGHTAQARYDPTSGDLDSEDHMQRIAEVRDALTAGEIVVHYQPKVDLHGETVTGVEALVRWQRPGADTIQPGQFLPLIEDAGLMTELTACVLGQATDQAAAWRADGLDLSVAVNLPPSAVTDTRLPAVVAGHLHRSGLPAYRLTLEITEDALIARPDQARSVLQVLRASGVRISIDDYGAGYSSLAYLRDLPIDELKIDRAFISPMTGSNRATAIVRSTIDLAHSLGLGVVAEGVEDAETARALASYGCDVAQGYYFAWPMPSAALREWWTSHHGTTQATAGSPPASPGAPTAGAPVGADLPREAA